MQNAILVQDGGAKAVRGGLVAPRGLGPLNISRMDTSYIDAHVRVFNFMYEAYTPREVGSVGSAPLKAAKKKKTSASGRDLLRASLQAREDAGADAGRQGSLARALGLSPSPEPSPNPNSRALETGSSTLESEA